MAGRPKKNYSKKQVLAAIAKSGGIVSNVGRVLGCSWHVAERNILKYPECKKALEEEAENTLDDIEQAGFNLAKNGDGAMIRFYLSTKGRKRGYVTDDKQMPADVRPQEDNTVHLIIDTTENKGQ